MLSWAKTTSLLSVLPREWVPSSSPSVILSTRSSQKGSSIWIPPPPPDLPLSIKSNVSKILEVEGQISWHMWAVRLWIQLLTNASEIFKVAKQLEYKYCVCTNKTQDPIATRKFISGNSVFYLNGSHSTNVLRELAQWMRTRLAGMTTTKTH